MSAVTFEPIQRAAGFDDLDPRTAYRLWQLRESVFVVEQECAYLELDGRDTDPGTLHLWLEEAGEPVAYLRLLTEPGFRRVGRVLTAPRRRGQGLAERLVRAALTRAGGEECRLDAQAHLEGWYARLGFERCGEPFVEDGIPHVPMRRGPAPEESQSARSRA
jgi:ElaA protein